MYPLFDYFLRTKVHRRRKGNLNLLQRILFQKGLKKVLHMGDTELIDMEQILAPIPKRTKTNRKGPTNIFLLHVVCVTYHMSLVICHIKCFACHLSLMPSATATDPPPANSPTMHSRLVWKYPKKAQNISKCRKSLKQWQLNFSKCNWMAYTKK